MMIEPDHAMVFAAHVQVYRRAITSPAEALVAFQDSESHVAMRIEHLEIPLGKGTPREESEATLEDSKNTNINSSLQGSCFCI